MTENGDTPISLEILPAPDHTVTSPPASTVSDSQAQKTIKQYEAEESLHMSINTKELKARPSALQPAITIWGTEKYHAQVEAALKKIYEGGPNGKKLVDGFAKAAAGKGNRLTIKQRATGTPEAFAYLNKEQEQKYNNRIGYNQNDLRDARNNHIATTLARRHWLGLGPKSKGTDAVVVWQPWIALDLDKNGRPLGVKADPETAHFSLAHEMCHARNITKGTFLGGIGERHQSWTPAGREEQKATHGGLFKGRFTRNGMSENLIRRELQVQERSRYNKVGPGKALAQEKSKSRQRSFGPSF